MITLQTFGSCILGKGFFPHLVFPSNVCVCACVYQCGQTNSLLSHKAFFIILYTLLCLFLCMWRSEDLQHSGRRKHILTFKSGFILDALHTCTVRPKVQGKALLKTSELKKLRYNLMRSVRLLCKIKFTLNMGNHIQNNMSCLVFLFVLLFCCRALFSQDKIHSLRKNILHTHTC